MPRRQTVLQIFLASPSDVVAERDLVEGVVSELNRIWSSTSNISYHVFRWEIDVTPGFAIEPQAVVNSQIPPDYDVFLGIFWGRIGTPTIGHASGTLEEFENALDRFRSTGSPEIVIYFKDTPIPPSKIDTSQLERLHEFKNRLPSQGGIYSTFEDQSSLEASLRLHLSVIAQKLATGFSSTESQTKSSSKDLLNQVEKPVVVDDDLGYLDYIDIYTS
jgi:hypothetical protein